MSSPLTFSSTLLTALADVDDANHSSSDNEDESEAEEEDDEDEDAFHIVAQHLAYGPGHPQWSGDLSESAGLSAEPQTLCVNPIRSDGRQ